MSERIKIGRGIEVSLETLIEVLADAWPGAVDWDFFRAHLPSVTYDAGTQALRLHATALEATDAYNLLELHADHGLRRISTGAPIPMTWLQEGEAVK